MDAQRVLMLLDEACHALEAGGEHAAAAYVGHAMDLIEQRHGVSWEKRPD